MTRIALVVPEYRTDVALGGGVASVADFLLDALSGWGDARVDLVSPRTWHRAPEHRRLAAPRSWARGPVVTQREVAGVSVRYVGASWGEFEASRNRSSKALMECLRGYDLIVTVSGTPAVCRMVERVNVPVVSQVATLAEKERVSALNGPWSLRRLLLRINTWITARDDHLGLRIPDVVIVENVWMRDKCVELGARRVELISPGVDTSRFRASETASAGGGGYILSVGRFDDPRKDLPTLFLAYRRALDEHGLNLRLVLAGRRGPSPRDRALLAKLGLDDLVDVRTGVSSDELVSLYQGAAFFMMASAEEGLGIVMLEAMACGLAVLSTATEGAKRIIGSSGAGRLVVFGPELASRFGLAMAEMAADVEGRAAMGQCGRSRVVAEFSTDAAGGLFREAIARVLKESSSRPA